MANEVRIQQLDELATRIQNKMASRVEQNEFYGDMTRLLGAIFHKRNYFHLTEQDKEDQINEALAEAFSRFDPSRGHFYYLLIKIFVCLCLKLNAKRSPERTGLDVEGTLQDDHEGTIPPVHILIKDEQLQMIRKALEQERQPSRMILEARYGWEPVCDRTTAQLLNKPYLQIKHIRHENLCHVRRWLTDQYPDIFLCDN